VAFLPLFHFPASSKSEIFWRMLTFFISLISVHQGAWQIRTHYGLNQAYLSGAFYLQLVLISWLMPLVLS
jgi:hypothetical protein